MSRVGPTRISRMIGLLLTAAKRALRWSTRDVAKRVDLTRSLHRLATTAICAFRPKTGAEAAAT
jgi:hypothetical protein